MVKHLSAILETTVRFLGREDPLEKTMAPHSSTPAWKIPWMEEPGGYSPWGRKESDMTERLQFLFTFIEYYKLIEILIENLHQNYRSTCVWHP